MTAHVAPQNVKIGVLALQGAFIEHVHMMARLAPHPPVVVEVCFFFFLSRYQEKRCFDDLWLGKDQGGVGRCGTGRAHHPGRREHDDGAGGGAIGAAGAAARLDCWRAACVGTCLFA